MNICGALRFFFFLISLDNGMRRIASGGGYGGLYKGELGALWGP